MEEMKYYQAAWLLLVGLLTIVFVTLKLCGVISWSWWWVLSPIWIDFALSLVIVIVIAAFLTYKKQEHS